jgi:hypothetical protein
MIEFATFLLSFFILAIVFTFGVWLVQRFWAWYEDAVWDQQEEDQPEPDDFPDRK